MPEDVIPSNYIASWSEDGTNITIPLASLPETDATEADGTTGDFRKVMYAWCKEVADHYDSLSTDDKPKKMKIIEGQTVDSSNIITKSYRFEFKLGSTGLEVTDE